jgi:hypothetical protein
MRAAVNESDSCRSSCCKPAGTGTPTSSEPPASERELDALGLGAGRRRALGLGQLGAGAIEQRQPRHLGLGGQRRLERGRIERGDPRIERQPPRDLRQVLLLGLDQLAVGAQGPLERAVARLRLDRGEAGGQARHAGHQIREAADGISATTSSSATSLT